MNLPPTNSTEQYCGSSKEKRVLVKSHRVPMGGQILFTEVFRCDACHQLTGTVRVEVPSTTG